MDGASRQHLSPGTVGTASAAHGASTYYGLVVVALLTTHDTTHNATTLCGWNWA